MLDKKKQYFDTKYIELFQNGDQAAFDIIFNYYKNHVYWTGINFFSNEEKAKDLVQSVFLEVYQNINKLKEPAKFYSWLNRIAYTRCMQMLRYEMKDSLYYTNNMVDEFADNFIEDSKNENPITYIQKQKIKEIVLKEIEELSPKYRTICYLRFFEDLSYAEINEITQVPLGTITNYIGRLKPKLQMALQKHGFTSASCLSLVALPNIAEYFKAFIDMKEPLTGVEVESIVQEVKCLKKKHQKQSVKSWQIIAYGCAVAIVMVSVAVGLVSRESHPIINVGSGDSAVIEEITYPEQLTNSPFKIQVKLSNDNYDEILLDDKKDLTVRRNGKYTIKLTQNGKVVDSKNIVITNIDRDIPLVTDELVVNGVITLILEDKDSQIDFEHIEFYENHNLTNNFKLDKEKKAIYISKDTVSDNVLKVPDIAGNILEVKIKFYETDAIK